MVLNRTEKRLFLTIFEILLLAAWVTIRNFDSNMQNKISTKWLYNWSFLPFSKSLYSTRLSKGSSWNMAVNLGSCGGLHDRQTSNQPSIWVMRWNSRSDAQIRHQHVHRTSGKQWSLDRPGSSQCISDPWLTPKSIFLAIPLANILYIWHTSLVKPLELLREN